MPIEFELILIIVAFGMGLILHNFLPSYANKKGENLATKEDIQEITRLTEEAQQEFKEAFEQFTRDLQFKYEYYFHQYEKLYCFLYAFVIQSEYVRKTIEAKENKSFPFLDYPFLTISRTHRTNQKVEFRKGQPPKYSETNEEIDTPVSDFNFDNLIAVVIDKEEYADQELLKSAVAYRFIDSIGKGNAEYENEGIKLQAEIVKHIVRQYNRLRKELKMSYSKHEMENGTLEMF